MPDEVTNVGFGKGTEFLKGRHPIQWAGEMKIFFVRSCPYKKSDQATFESENNDLVRKHGFCYRYDTNE